MDLCVRKIKNATRMNRAAQTKLTSRRVAFRARLQEIISQKHKESSGQYGQQKDFSDWLERLLRATHLFKFPAHVEKQRTYLTSREARLARKTAEKIRNGCILWLKKNPKSHKCVSPLNHTPKEPIARCVDQDLVSKSPHPTFQKCGNFFF